jgi:general secretion pathway protein G
MEFLTRSGETMIRGGFRSRRLQNRNFSGFTLIELLVVLAIVGLLVSLSVPRYFQVVATAKEKVLVENLRITRDVLDKFHSDTGMWPLSLAELVEKRYLKTLPYDPITESSQTWIVIEAEGNGPRQKGILDIRSGATGKNRSGRAFTDL